MNIDRDARFDPVENWLGNVAYSKSGSKSTQVNYRRNFSSFCGFIGETGANIETNFKKVKTFIDERRFKKKYTDYVRRWIVALKQKGYTDTSVKTTVAAVQSFFKYNDFPLGFIPMAQDNQYYHNRDLTREEIADIMKVSIVRDRAFYAVMAQSGLRPHTLCKLQLKHLQPDWNRRTIPCRIEVWKENSKGGYLDHFTFIGAEAVQALRDYLKTRASIISDSYLFVKAGTENTSSTPAGFSAQFNKTVRMLKAKGVLDFEERPRKPSEIRLYNLRKFFKKHTHEAGEEFSEFWMGHKGKGVVDNYRTRDVEYHRKLYAERAAPFLRIEARTPTETEKTISEQAARIDKLEKELKELRAFADFMEKKPAYVHIPDSIHGEERLRVLTKLVESILSDIEEIRKNGKSFWEKTTERKRFDADS